MSRVLLDTSANSAFMRGDAAVRERLRQLLSSSRVSVVPVDDETAERYAVILNGLWAAGTPIPTNDIWIVASAMQYGLTVVTTETHFLRIPQIPVSHSSPAT